MCYSHPTSQEFSRPRNMLYLRYTLHRTQLASTTVAVGKILPCSLEVVCISDTASMVSIHSSVITLDSFICGKECTEHSHKIVVFPLYLSPTVHQNLTSSSIHFNKTGNWCIEFSIHTHYQPYQLVVTSFNFGYLGCSSFTFAVLERSAQWCTAVAS